MTSNTASSSPSVYLRLSLMMFLQFFIWGAWFATLGQCLGSNGLGDFGARAYGTAPIAAIIAPLFLGLVADRFFASQFIMGILFLLAGGFHFLGYRAAVAGQGDMMIWFFLGHMLCYMPTLGLGNTVAFSHLPFNVFPKVRVWGTIGWIAAGLAVGFLGWTSSLNLLLLSGWASLALGAVCFALPNTPAPAKGKPINLRALFLVDAFRLLGRPSYLVFIVCSCLICVPLAYYFGLTSNYLTTAGFEQAASTMTLGQMSEIFFMLLIPFFFRRLGVKWMILVGMLAWVARYALFAFGAPAQVAWMLLAGIILHGICYDFFFVTGFMYTDRTASLEIRSQAQSMLVFFTQGLGMYFGYQVAFDRFQAVVTGYAPLNDTIKAARGSDPLSFAQQLGKMFSFGLPEKVDGKLLTETMTQWKAFWTLPALMALGIAILFLFTFRDRETDTAMRRDSRTAD